MWVSGIWTGYWSVVLLSTMFIQRAILLLSPQECLTARHGPTSYIISLAITINSMYWREADALHHLRKLEDCSVWSLTSCWMTHLEEWGTGITGKLVLSANVYGALLRILDMNYLIFSSPDLKEVDIVVITILWLRNWGLQGLGNMPEATQPVSGRARTWMQVCLVQSPGTLVPGKATRDCQPLCSLNSSLGHYRSQIYKGTTLRTMADLLNYQ